MKPRLPPSLLRRAPGAATLIATAALALRRLDDSDTWWHLASGRWIAENWRVPATDPLSHTVPDHAWINLQWLYDLTLYGLWRLGGADALVLAAVAAYTGAVWLLLGTLRRWVGVSLASLLALWALLVAEERFLIRPEMVSFVLLGLVLRVLLTASREHPRGLLAVPLLTLLWVNSHSLFVIGLFCIACAAGGAAASQLTQRATGSRDGGGISAGPLVACALAAVLAAFVNPYFWRGAVFPLELLTRIDGSRSVFQSIGEFRPPWSGYFETLAISAYQSLAVFSLTIVVLALGVRAFGRRRVGTGFAPGALASFAALLYVSTLARRNIALFALGAVPTMAMALAVLDDALAPRLRAALRKIEPALAGAVTVAGLGLTVWVATNGYYRWNGSTHAFGAGVFEANFPVHAVDFAREAGLAPRLYNDLSAGGYLTWDNPVEGGVFIDGRLEVYDTAFFTTYRQTLEDAASWEAAIRRYGVETVILFHRWPNRHGLIRRLAADPRWALLHEDEVAVVFARQGSFGEVVPLMRRYAEATKARLAERRAARWQYPLERAVALRSYADLQIVLGDFAAALSAYEDLLDLALPVREEVEARYRAGVVLARRGETNRARGMLERARRLAPTDVRVLQAIRAIDAAS